MAGWLGVAGFVSFAIMAVAQGDSVAAQFHFAGVKTLDLDTNFNAARRVLGEQTSVEFRELVLGRLTKIAWKQLQFDPHGNPGSQLRPLLDDMLDGESVASFGGGDPHRLDFVICVKMTSARAGAWSHTLAAALAGPGENDSEAGFSGLVWHRGNGDSFWLIRAGDWTVVARGDDLSAARQSYLRQIQQQGRPAPALHDCWFETDADWVRLQQWLPIADCPLKPPRTIVKFTTGKDRLWVKGSIIYPTALPWHSSPWQPPKGLVSEPLISFTAGQDVEPFLRSDSWLAGMAANPFANQLYIWSMGEMPIQSYAAWPVANAGQKLAADGPRLAAEFNPILAARDHTKLTWIPKLSQLMWSKSSIMAPFLTAVRDNNADFEVAELFPLSSHYRPVPSSLWQQFEGRDDLVWYDWERTGIRLQQWRFLCELLPVLPPVSSQAAAGTLPAYVIVDNWMAALARFLGPVATVTEITRQSPTQFNLVRSSPLILTAFEWTWLSHWLADAPSGPVNYGLLPRARMSGPGLPR